jgi:hypothetical protein
MPNEHAEPDRDRQSEPADRHYVGGIVTVGRAALAHLAAAPADVATLDLAKEWRKRALDLGRPEAILPEAADLLRDFRKLCNRLNRELPKREGDYARAQRRLDEPMTPSERQALDRKLEAQRAVAPADQPTAVRCGVMSAGQIDALQMKNRQRAAGLGPPSRERVWREVVGLRSGFEATLRRRSRPCVIRLDSNRRERRARRPCMVRRRRSRATARSGDPPGSPEGEGEGRHLARRKLSRRPRRRRP